MVDPPEVNATGDPIGDACGEAAGEANGDAAGLALGVATELVDVTTRVGMGAGVDVGASGDESPPQAPTIMATSNNARNVLHGAIRNVRNFVPYPVGIGESRLCAVGTVPESPHEPTAQPR